MFSYLMSSFYLLPCKSPIRINGKEERMTRISYFITPTPPSEYNSSILFPHFCHNYLFSISFFPLWSLSARSRCELTQQTDKGEVNQYKMHQNPSLTQTTWRVIHIFLSPFLIFISLITAYTLANKETFWNQSFRIRNNISYNWKDLSYSRFYTN